MTAPEPWATELGPWVNPGELTYVTAVLFGRPVSEDSFVGRLAGLLPSADSVHRGQLRQGFPELVGAWEAWMASPDGTGWEGPFWRRLA